MAIQTDWTEDDMVPLRLSDPVDVRDFAAAVSRAIDSIRQWAEGVRRIAGDWVMAIEMHKLRLTPHDYAAARVQLRREGAWTPGDPAPLAAIEERARLLALMAWARDRRDRRSR